MMFGIDINFYQFSDVDPRKRNDCDILHFAKRTKQRLCSTGVAVELGNPYNLNKSVNVCEL